MSNFGERFFKTILKKYSLKNIFLVKLKLKNKILKKKKTNKKIKIRKIIKYIKQKIFYCLINKGENDFFK